MSNLSVSITSTLELCRNSGNIFLAFSGGLDSHVLLHLYANQESLIKKKLTAVYVDHGLHPESESWGLHCGEIAAKAGIDFIRLHVNGQPNQGESREEAARNARYNALKKLVETGDILLTGQHREDQLETILLQLFRGSGLSGLSGMPFSAKFGKGQMLRPLLAVPKRLIRDYAIQHRLSWIEDPSNNDCDLDRNFLRNQVIPLLRQRWPSVDTTVSRSGQHCAEANSFLVQMADELLDAALDQTDQTLLIDRTLLFKDYEQRMIVRAWFKVLGLRMPSTHVVDRIMNQLIASSPGASPSLQGSGYMIRRYRNKVYRVRDLPEVEAESDMKWPEKTDTVCLKNNGQLVRTATMEAGISSQMWEKSEITIRYRQGGEVIRLPGRAGTHTLKNLFQEAGVPPWERGIVPLIYLDNTLAVVGNYWVNAEYYRSGNMKNLHIQWQPPQTLAKGHDEIVRVD